jgi:hypothetical protein
MHWARESERVRFRFRFCTRYLDSVSGRVQRGGVGVEALSTLQSTKGDGEDEDEDEGGS